MHPLIAQIHPAHRTALLAWLLSRAALFFAVPPSTRTLDGGAPLAGLMATGVEALAAMATPALSVFVLLLPWILVEIAMLAAGVAVYRFARISELPQVAERACWFWFFNPALAMTITDWSAQMAAAFGALAIASLITYRARFATLAILLAMGCRLEFVILWPALAIAGWRYYRPGKDWSLMPWSGMLTPLLGFIGWVAIAWNMAGLGGSSLRAIHEGAAWRTGELWWALSTVEVVLAIAVATALLLALVYARRLPLWHLALVLPALLWPFSQVPATFAVIALCWSLPTFLHLAKSSEDRALERPLLAALLLGFFFALP